MMPEFEPGYFSFLDEIYHSNWALKKKIKIQQLRKAIAYFWPAGHPSRLIQVTGTNGKGSVSFNLEQGFMLTGNTGSWTGPHVFDYAERFHINGRQVEHDQIVDIYRSEIEPYQLSVAAELGQESLGFASLGILISLKLFERNKVDWGILEVGAGGRYTPLMAVDVAACVLTNVGYDHPLTLGSEIWQRALEKAGIARPGIPFFSSEMGEARDYVRQTVEKQGGVFHGVTAEDINDVQKNMKKKLPAFASRNLALSLKVVKHFFPETDTLRALDAMRTLPKGRFWAFQGSNIIVDVAHNVDKIAALADQLTLQFPGQKFKFMLGLTRKRDPLEVFAPILPLAQSILLTSASYPGQNPHELASKLRTRISEVEVVENPVAAFEKGKSELKKGEILVLTGSAYMIDQALSPNPFLAHINASFGWRGSGSTGSL